MINLKNILVSLRDLYINSNQNKSAVSINGKLKMICFYLFPFFKYKDSIHLKRNRCIQEFLRFSCPVNCVLVTFLWMQLD